MIELENLKNEIKHVIERLNFHKQLVIRCGLEAEYIEPLDNFVKLFESVMKIANTQYLSINYIKQFSGDFISTLNILPYKDAAIIEDEMLRHVKRTFQDWNVRIADQFIKVSFNVTFFKNLGFFNNNIVAIGANGSGKTSLADKLKSYIKPNGVVVSAQRILSVPNFGSIGNPAATGAALKSHQLVDKSNKVANQTRIIEQEFTIVLQHLLAENISIANTFKIKAIEQSNDGKPITPPPVSNLDKALEIWNSLVEHRIISCKDGMNILIGAKEAGTYPIVQMSDGEKVILFLIAQILQAPSNGFVIIDEPEMYLHKTILKKLWDILEQERQDCIFVYLTHDLDFATSRTTAKKIWIKSFSYPDNWEIEDIPENELPESLLLELLGSRKNILFCEGDKGSIDDKIYNILFPNLTVTPVGGCFEVINHTKAFNKLSNITTKAWGLIDSDHHIPERLAKLKARSIYSLSVAEVENLLLDENFLNLLSSNIMTDEHVIKKIKEEVINELQEHKETQISNYVSNKIDYYYKDSNIEKANKLEDLKTNYENFNKEINVDKLYNERAKEIDRIIQSNDYDKAIAVYNNKGLRKIVNSNFKITDFVDKAIKLLQFKKESHALLLKYFPNELTSLR